MLEALPETDVRSTEHISDMSFVHSPEETPLDSRQLAVPIAIILLLIIFIARLWFLQIAGFEDSKRKVTATGEMKVEQLAPRGQIVDRHGEILAGVRPTIVVSVVYNQVKGSEGTLERLRDLLQISQAELDKGLRQAEFRPDLPYPVAIGVSHQTASIIADEGSRLPGVSVGTQPMRYYKDTISLAHLMGYVWKAGEKDVERLESRGLRPAQYVGREGLELYYESLLMGEPGWDKVRVDVRGRPLNSLGRDRAVPGNKLILSLDYDMQVLAQQLLQGYRGALVALDPSNGEILSIVSSPTYDIGKFIGGISNQDYQELLDHPGKPQFNRAISGQYPPASTFKIVVSYAAYRAGQMDFNRTVHCPGYFQVGNRRVNCLGPRGNVAFEEAIAKSSNTYFADLTMRIGPQALRDGSKELLFGGRIGVDIPGEVSGLIPDEEEIRKRHNRNWFHGDTVNMALGQGDTLVTPMQMAVLASVVANGGYAYKPHILRAYVPPGNEEVPVETKPEQIINLQQHAEFWSRMRSAMARIFVDGTARRSRIEGLKWAGKTGSAEVFRQVDTHSWFVGFAPYDQPQIAIAVVIEQSGHGGDVAAPIASQYVKRLLTKRGYLEPEVVPIPDDVPDDSSDAAEENASPAVTASRTAVSSPSSPAVVARR